LVVTAACASIDERTEAARKRILALDAVAASRIVTFCKAWKQTGALQTEQFPSALPAQPTTADAYKDAITFQWWNNSHAEDDRPHPGFELICSDARPPGATSIAPGLWYRDMPMNSD
jgi:hypothetical protein